MYSTVKGLQLALRRVFRSKWFAVTSIVTLALGIGANVAIFSVIHAALIKPLPYRQPEELVAVWHRAPGLNFDQLTLSAATYLTFRDQARSLAEIGMWEPGTLTVTGDGPPEEVEDMLVTGEVLPMLGVRPGLGRLFGKDDTVAGNPQTVILSHEFWQRRFGGAQDIVGRDLLVYGRPREIVGVLPVGFRLLRHQPDVYYPLQLDEANVRMGRFNYYGIARLAPGSSVEQVATELDSLTAIASERFPRGLSLEMLREAGFGSYVVPLAEEMVGDIASALWLLLGTVGVVLLIACANVANLFLVRAEGRRREVALRTAIGASRLRLAGEFLAESLILSLLGGVLGCAMAWAGLRLLVVVGPSSLPRLWEVGINGPVLLFALVLSLASGVLFGMLPVLREGYGNLSTALKEGDRAASDGRQRHLLRSGLVIVQIAMTLILLIGAGLMMRSYAAIQSVDLGVFDPGSVLSFRASIPSAEVAEPEEVLLTEERILDELRTLPGVVSVATSDNPPMDGRGSQDPISVEGFPLPEDQLPTVRRYRFVSGDYFSTLGRPILAGRAITWDDVRQRRKVVVVSENFAREYWPELSQALGRRVSPDLPSEGAPWREIVGVVSNVYDDGATSEPPPMVYWPQAIEDFWGEELFVQRTRTYLLRVDGVPANTVLAQAQAAVLRVNPNLPIARPETLRQVADRSITRTTFTLVMLAIASGVALLLGVVGIYGVISYIVAQRTREIGVRMALGAKPGQVGALIVRHALKLAGLGLACGALGAFAATRLMNRLLFGIEATDPLTFVTVSILLAIVTVVAGAMAARRATRVDPLVALHAD